MANSQHRSFSRSDRISEQIRRELADLLRFHLKDQRIANKLTLITLSDVEVTPDYAHAKVFYTSMASAADNVAIAAGLKRAAGFLRRELGRRIRIHQTPELHFVFDASVAEGARLSQLIDAAVKSDQNADQGTDQSAADA